MSTVNRPEFSRAVSIEDIESGVVKRQLEANDEERSALAVRFGLLSADTLSASVTLRRLPASPLVRVEGHLTADVTQPCIVTLAPVADHIDANFSEIYCPVGYEPRDEMEEDEIIDIYDDGGIDIGELVAQHLAISLNLYPRAEGVELPGNVAEEPGSPEVEKERPLAGLGELLRKRQ